MAPILFFPFSSFLSKSTDLLKDYLLHFFLYSNIIVCNSSGYVESYAHYLRCRGRLSKPVVPQQDQNAACEADCYTGAQPPAERTHHTHRDRYTCSCWHWTWNKLKCITASSTVRSVSLGSQCFIQDTGAHAHVFLHSLCVEGFKSQCNECLLFSPLISERDWSCSRVDATQQEEVRGGDKRHSTHTRSDTMEIWVVFKHLK